VRCQVLRFCLKFWSILLDLDNDIYQEVAEFTEAVNVGICHDFRDFHRCCISLLTWEEL